MARKAYRRGLTTRIVRVVSTTETEPGADLELLLEARAAAESGAARWLRQAAGLSQREMADAIGRTPGCVSLWEHGGRKPTGEGAIRYARALRVIASQVASRGPASRSELASIDRAMTPYNDVAPAGNRREVTTAAEQGRRDES